MLFPAYRHRVPYASRIHNLGRACSTSLIPPHDLELPSREIFHVNSGPGAPGRDTTFDVIYAVLGKTCHEKYAAPTLASYALDERHTVISRTNVASCPLQQLAHAFERSPVRWTMPRITLKTRNGTLPIVTPPSQLPARRLNETRVKRRL